MQAVHQHLPPPYSTPNTAASYHCVCLMAVAKTRHCYLPTHILRSTNGFIVIHYNNSVLPCSCVLWVLAGAAFALVSSAVNLNHFSNALTLWLGMHPTFLFFQIFLPPLLLDSALRIDFFLFKKVRLWLLLMLISSLVAHVLFHSWLLTHRGGAYRACGKLNLQGVAQFPACHGVLFHFKLRRVCWGETIYAWSHINTPFSA